MNIKEPRYLLRVGHIVQQITAEAWPMRLGKWDEVEDRCQRFADTASEKVGVSGWSGAELKEFIYRLGLIGYDSESGLWYCRVFTPTQDYPDNFKTDEVREREKVKAVFSAESVKEADDWPKAIEAIPRTPKGWGKTKLGKTQRPGW